jgi:large subunit ribosomal protein L2
MNDLFNNLIVKRLRNGKKFKESGRNNKGKITIRHKGGACDRIFRIVNFQYYLWNIYGIVTKFVYDPNRSGLLMLICYLNGIVSYHLAIKGSNLGDMIFIGSNGLENLKKNVKLITSFFYKFSNGILINNLSVSEKKQCVYVRSAGTVAQLLKVDSLRKEIVVRLPSKEERIFLSNGICTTGQLANFNSFLLEKSMAGRVRHLGVRPCVRGVAMNPIDHPHGGGQGKTSGAGGRRSQVTFTGKVAKTQPTRNKSKSNIFILRKRKK